jgi:hypothetical protein
MVQFLLAEGRAPVGAFDVALSTEQPEQRTGCLSLCPIIVALECNWPASILQTLVREGADLAGAARAVGGGGGGMGVMAVAAIHERMPHLRALMRLGLTPDAEAFRQAAIANRPRSLRLLAFPEWRPPLHLRGNDDNNNHNDDDDSSSGDDEVRRGGIGLIMPPPTRVTLMMARGESVAGGGAGGMRLPTALRASRALVAAVRHDAFQAAELLRDLGARTTSALIEAVQLNRPWAVRLLAVEGALPAAWPDWEDTPLTLAVRLLRTSIVHCLLEKGRLTPALLNARRGGKDPRTALDLALGGHHRNYERALRAAGGLTSTERAAASRSAGQKRSAPPLDPGGDGDGDGGVAAAAVVVVVVDHDDDHDHDHDHDDHDHHDHDDREEEDEAERQHAAAAAADEEEEGAAAVVVVLDP